MSFRGKTKLFFLRNGAKEFGEGREKSLKFVGFCSHGCQLCFLFVCLFYDAASNSGCLALNGRMIDEFDGIEKEGGWFCA